MKRRWQIAVALLFLLLVWVVCFWQKGSGPAALGKKWHEQAYGLDEGEMARLVPPPYSPQRMAEFGRSWAGTPPAQTGQNVYHVMAGQQMQWGMSSASGTLLSALTFANGLTGGDLDMARNLGGLQVNGDWIIRIDGPLEERMKAIESIVNQATQVDLKFENRLAERDVIVARGNWVQTKLEGVRKNSLNSVHFYTDKLDPAEGAGGGSGDFKELMHRLEEIAGRKVIDEVSQRPAGRVEWANNYSEYPASKNEVALEQLLANLQKQTGLEYVRTKRAMPTWFIEDKAATTRPAGGP